MTSRVPVIDYDACIACGNCETLCPGVFHVDESLGHSVVVNPQGAPEDRIQEAIDQCPVQCITWGEDDS